MARICCFIMEFQCLTSGFHHTLKVNHGQSASQNNSNKPKHCWHKLLRYEVPVLTIWFHYQTLKVNHDQSALEETSIKPEHDKATLFCYGVLVFTFQL
ncbi:hypothetical protein EVAR_13235_1 [Eumeta japonica]|uniref:Uncharacterized protein n=1 Tax=Eumeta variegata TaxID=151549 RepID=A0A4C1TS79_EUMVA|nr:hypothetical protein EVAR_13235_1 [Eumeta japonica]